jgi:hypothetical protein
MWREANRNSTQIDESFHRQINGTLCKKYHSVEMKPVKALPIYQFKLYQVQDKKGAFLFIKPDSEIVEYLKTDRVFEMKYLPKDFDSKFRSLPTRIKSISKEHYGPFKGHYKVGISIAKGHWPHYLPPPFRRLRRSSFLRLPKLLRLSKPLRRSFPDLLSRLRPFVES